MNGAIPVGANPFSRRAVLAMFLLLVAMAFIVLDVEIAREVAHEAFCRALERWDRISGYERPGAWVKLKLQKSDEFVVGGYLPGSRYFDELLVRRWEGKRLLFVESVKDGFVNRTKRQVLELAGQARTKHCPFANLPERGAGDERGEDGERDLGETESGGRGSV